MKTLFSGRSDMPFAMLLLAPSLILLGGLVAWPMISNIEISFLRLPLNPRIDAVFVGLDNYIRILSDAAFWHSLWMTFWYTALVVMGSIRRPAPARGTRQSDRARSGGVPDG